MKKQNKLRVIQDYEKISKDIKEQIKLVYPEGFSDNLIEFRNAKGEKVSALPFETDDKIYMIRMSVSKAEQIIKDDEDYDEYGILKVSTKEKYEDKYSDIDYMSEYIGNPEVELEIDKDEKDDDYDDKDDDYGDGIKNSGDDDDDDEDDDDDSIELDDDDLDDEDDIK